MADKKLLIAVGGTGGHIYPALGLAHRLLQLEPTLSVHFVGGGLSRNRHFNDLPFPCSEVACGTISLRKPFSVPFNLVRIAKGTRQSYQFIQEFKPSLVVGFGSYHSLPTLMGAKLANIPFVLHEQNSVPGRVNRFLSKYAAFTGTSFPCVKNHLKGKCLDVAMPLREGFCLGSHTQEEAKKIFGLDPDKPVVLVFGGSQGARRINQLFAEGVDGPVFGEIQLLHFTGNSEYTKSLSERYQTCGVRACVKDYEDRMDMAWTGADLVVSRAGAGSIAEQIEFEVPGILIPYPFAMDNHQEFNADFMVEQVRGAIKQRERTLTPEQLVQKIVDAVKGGGLLTMKQQIKDYKAQQQTRDLSTVIREML